MHISVQSLLNHEHPYYRIGNIEIYLDGVKQSHVYEIDTLGTLNEPRGWIKKHKLDGNGELVILDDSLVEETLYGNVEIKLKETL